MLRTTLQHLLAALPQRFCPLPGMCGKLLMTCDLQLRIPPSAVQLLPLLSPAWLVHSRKLSGLLLGVEALYDPLPLLSEWHVLNPCMALRPAAG